MKKTLLASAGALSLIGLAASAPAFGQEMMAHAYEVTVTNSMPTEFIAPVLVTGTDHDGAIFANHYVTPEAEAQVLTGDPAKLAAKIGSDAAVAHSDGGAPGVLLAPGKSLTFKVETAAKEIRVFAMVAPTEKPDNYLTATVKLAPMDDKMDSMAMAKDTMAEGAMAKDAMAKDAMAKDEMMAEPMMIPSGRALRVGSRGKRVAMLRERLGVKAMETDPNVFDSALKSAVMDYQTKVGLAADGVVGPMTLKSLNNPPMEDAMAKDEMMAKDTMAKDTMAEGSMKKDAMAKDTMAESSMKKDTMAEGAMAKDAMAKDSMAKDEMMMEDGGMSAALHRFDIGHDENTKTITEIDGTFGTVTVKAL